MSRPPYSHVDGAYPNLFVDTELATGLNDGTDWENAYQSFTDLHTNNNNDWNYDVYIKAPALPHRAEMLAYAGFAGKNFYFNATGVGTALHENRRGIYFGSDQIDISGATLVSGTEYKIAWAGNAVFELDDAAGKFGVWLGTDPDIANEYYYATITALKGASPYNNTNVVSGRYFYDSTANELYFNLGRAPVSGDYFECRKFTRVVEIYDSHSLHGGIFRFGNSGQDNGTCTDSLVRFCDFSHNALFGFDTAPYPKDGTGGYLIVEGCTINNNGVYGVNNDGNGEGFIVRFSTIMNNEVIGYVNKGIDSGVGTYLNNCVITGSPKGVLIGNGSEISDTTFYNNIIWDNTTDLDIVNHANVAVTYDYNAVETFSGKAATQTNDVTIDPTIDSDGRIDSGSSAYGAGKDDVYSESVYDPDMLSVTQSDGSPYGVMNMGAYGDSEYSSGNDFYIAITRRTASQMRPKQRMQKPKRGLFR